MPKTVEHYDRLQLALVCVSKINGFLDHTFGKRLITKKVVFRCSAFSTSLLVLTMSFLGYVNSQPFGTAPWKNYTDSIRYALTTTEELSSPSNEIHFTQLNLSTLTPENKATSKYVVNINSNLFLLTVSTNGVHDLKRVYQIGHGELIVYYQRYFPVAGKPFYSTNLLGDVENSTNPFDAMRKDMAKVTDAVAKYNKFSYAVVYSIAYYLVLFAVNAFLFIVSLASCRILLREIEVSGRILSTAALFVGNIIVIFSLSCLLLLFFTILAVPLFWIVIPYLVTISEESALTAAAYLISGAFAVWINTGTAAKLIVFITFLPSAFAAFVTLFTLLAIKWRNAFYVFTRFVLIRCAEKSPVGFLIAIITFLSGILIWLSQLTHFTGFL